VTKGRKGYLAEALNSYEKFIETGDVNVILIDNGSDKYSKEILDQWRFKYNSKVQYFRSETNEQLSGVYFWEKIKAFNPEWILFPGDDDVLVFDIYEEWRGLVEDNDTLTAFATCAQIIDSKGIITGEIRTPAIDGVTSQIELLAQSLHEPPFFWPGLFIKFAAIPDSIIYSRFVFDWWISLHLIIKGQIKSTKSIGINYRVHEGQESFQTTSRRKIFEGYNMLTTVINCAEFRQLLEQMTNLEIQKLLELCIDIKPLYAQSEYYTPLIKELSLNITRISKSNHIGNYVSEKYALSAGIYTKKGDLENIYTGLNLNSEGSTGNFTLTFAENVCSYLYNIGNLFNENANSKIYLSCKHSKHTRGSIFIDCSKFIQLNQIEICDSILISINNNLENSGSLSFTISPFERALIIFIRKLKIKFPKASRKYLVNLKTFIGAKNEF